MQVQIVAPWPDDDELSEALRKLTQAIDFVGAADGKAGGLFGGRWGYGADYENDVFLMHRYCWCEQETCPWCGGCQSEPDLLPHTPDCYQERKRKLLRGASSPWGMSDRRRAEYERERDRLCINMGLDPKDGSEVHCTCGADDEWRRRCDACQCDWHLGTKQFRFGPATSAPHFWHKASGAQVRWYKYIGRGMEVTKPTTGTWSDVFSQCHASLESATNDPAVVANAGITTG